TLSLIVYIHLPSFPHQLLRTPRSTLSPYTTLFRSSAGDSHAASTATKPDSVHHQSPIPQPKQTIPSGRHCGASLKSSWIHWSSRSEEHTSELQSRFDLVCRLLLEKKNK